MMVVVAARWLWRQGGCGGDGDRLSWRGESSKKGIQFCKKIQLGRVALRIPGIQFCKKIQLGRVALRIPYASKISLVEVRCSDSTIICVVAKISTEMFARLKY